MTTTEIITAFSTLSLVCGWLCFRVADILTRLQKLEEDTTDEQT